MKFTKNIKILVLIFCFLLVVVVFFLSIEPRTVQCAKPIEEFAYNWSEWATYQPTPLPLNGDWQMVTEEITSTLSYFDYLYAGEDELWFTHPLRKYIPSTGKFNEYYLANGNGQEIEVQSIIFTVRGEVWGLGRILGEGLYIFYFDRERNSIELVEDTGGYLSVSSPDGRNHLVEDSNGLLWFIFNGTMFRFNPNTTQLDQIIGRNQGFEYFSSQLVITSEDEIWAPAEVLQSYPNQIYLGYDISTGDYRTAIRLTESTTQLDQIFVDHLDRVWVANFGWIDTQPEEVEVYRLIENPIFLHDIHAWGLGLQYGWSYPRAKLETENRYIWFIGPSGFYRLDSVKEEWCLMSTERVSDIDIDADGTIWLLKEDGLYKLEP